jgi:hypothetical protein
MTLVTNQIRNMLGGEKENYVMAKESVIDFGKG